MTIGTLINQLAGGGTNWRDRLKPASFRNVPFAVQAADGTFGRRNAVHQYPFRDTVWVEDLGRSARKFRVAGFLVGDDVQTQRDRMIAAAEAPGDGKLIHPTLGELTVSLLDLQTAERWESGRVVELTFTFIEAGKRVFPSAVTTTGGAVADAAIGADAAANGSFLSRVGAALQAGAAVVQGVVAEVAHWVGMITRFARDATSLIKTVQSLPGQFGRFFAGASATLLGPAPALGLSAGDATTIAALIAAGASARANVRAAGNSALVAAGQLSAANSGAFAGQVQAATEALRAAAVDPADQIRILTPLAGFTPARQTGAAPVARAMATVQAATGDLIRRAAITSLARAASAYQPSSYDDAASLRTSVTGLMDAEIMVAGNQGEDAVFLALRTLRGAVSQDLTARGASLAKLTTIDLGATLPAPVLAMRLYQDASRTDELVAEAGAVHPAFVPVKFRALAS